MRTTVELAHPNFQVPTSENFKSMIFHDFRLKKVEKSGPKIENHQDRSSIDENPAFDHDLFQRIRIFQVRRLKISKV